MPSPNTDEAQIITPFDGVVTALTAVVGGSGGSATLAVMDDSQYHVDVLIDDRDERPGVMFADLELIGVPHRVTIGERGLKEGTVEYQERRDSAAIKVPLTEIGTFMRERLGA